MMKVNLDFGFKSKEGEEAVDPREATLNILEKGMVTLFPKGIRGSMQRRWATIQNKFKKAVEEKADEIDFDSSELSLFEDILSKVEYPVGNAKHIQMISDAIAVALNPEEKTNEVEKTVEADAKTEATPEEEKSA